MGQWKGTQMGFNELSAGDCFVLAVDSEKAGTVVYMKTLECTTSDRYVWACCLASGKLYDFYSATRVVKLDKMDVMLWLLNTPRMG